MNKIDFYKINQLVRIILLFTFFLAMIENSYASSVYTKKTNPITVSNHFSHSQKLIVLIHGLMRTSSSMNSLRTYLEQQGYQVYIYSYPSTKYTIHQHSEYLTHFIKKLLIQHPGATLYFITHSLGGIIARDSLAQLPPSQLKNMGSLIMLAPPNQGSMLAKLSTTFFPIISYIIKPLAELSSEPNSYVHHVPIPKVKIGIIAGRYDAKVPPAATRLNGQAEPVIVNSTHMFIMSNKQTKQLISRFLEKGTFVE